MDDTTKTEQDSLLGEGQASAGEAGATSEDKAVKTFSEEDLTKEVSKRVSDALAAAGRTDKEFAAREANIKAQEESIKEAQAKIDDFQKRLDEAELEEARTDPAKMREYQRKQKEKRETADLDAQRADIKKQREELERDKAENESKAKAASSVLKEIKYWQVGAKYGISPVVLKELDVPIDKAETIAQKLSGVKPEAEATAEGVKPFTPPGGNVVSHGTLTPDQFERLPMSEKAKYLHK